MPINQAFFTIKLLFLVFLLTWHPVSAQLTTQSGWSNQNTQTSRSEVTFIENAGQVHDQHGQLRSDVLFMGVSSQSQLVISDWGYSHQLHAAHYSSHNPDDPHLDPEVRLADSVQFARVDLQWVGAQGNVQVEKLNPTARVFNYYNLPYNSDGVTGVKEFESVRVGDIYPGINVRFYDAGGLFEHDYELEPGADYRDIRIRISGTNAHLNSKEELVLETALGTITESSPVVFQNGKELQSNWIQLENNLWGFEIPDADPQWAMVIDPISRVWGTYYGGNNLDEIFFTKVDSEDNVYVGGGTTSPMNIATAGTEQTTIASGSDAFLAKFDSDGNQIWGTYLGGNGNEATRGLDFDEFGNIFIIGYTESTNNISTPGSHQEVKGDAGNLFDGFLIKFSPDGIREWGTYYGGLYDDRPRFIHIGADGHIFVTGVTTSENNIATPGSHQEVYLDGTDDFGNDAFLVKFTADGVRLWATYYGGLLEDQAFTMTTDSDLNIYMIGHAVSLSNIATPGSFQPDHGGGEWDLFLVKFNPEGVRQWATYFGGNGDEYTWNSCISGNNAIYITGRTTSNNAIATDGTHQEFLAGSFDAFLMKVSLDGDKLWGTYFGGSNFERAYGCECLDDGSVIIAGRTESDNLISTLGVHQENHGGGIDAFLSKFNSDGTLYWSTYYGGNSNDIGYGSSMDSEGAIYLAGWSESNTDISTTGIHQEVYAGSRDGFIAKFAVCENSFSSISASACNSYTAPDGEILLESGDYTAVIPNNSGCDSIISISLTINPTYENSQFVTLCEGESHTLPDGTEVSSGGTYLTEFTTTAGCDSTINTQVDVFQDYALSYDIDLCENDTLIDPLGNQISDPGEYTYEFTSVNGCDSVIQWSIEEFPSFTNTTSAQICEGEEYITPGGQILTGAGIVEEVFTTGAGCDSTFITELVVLPSYSFTTDTVICENQTYPLPDGTTVNEPGEYYFEYVTQAGCDSTYVISLEVTTDIEISENIELCAGQSIELPDGTVIQPEQNADYQITISGENGCDSIYNIAVAVSDSYEVDTEVDICEGEEYQLPNGEIVSAPGSYTSVMLTAAGCDSIVNTNLEMLPAPEVTLDIPDAFCFEEAFVPLNPTPTGGTLSGDFVDGNGLHLEDAPAGNYSLFYEYSDENGCSIQIEEAFSVLPFTQPVFSYSADCLYRVDFSNQTNGESLSFEWSLDSIIFSDETSPTYAFGEEGEYTIELVATNAAGCEYNYTETITLSDGFSPEDFWVPNVITPNGDGKNDVLKTMPEDQNCVEYEIMIFNRWGMKVYESSHSGTPFDGRDIDGQKLPDGTYFYILESPQINCKLPDWEQFCQGTITILR